MTRSGGFTFHFDTWCWSDSLWRNHLCKVSLKYFCVFNYHYFQELLNRLIFPIITLTLAGSPEILIDEPLRLLVRKCPRWCKMPSLSLNQRCQSTEWKRTERDILLLILGTGLDAGISRQWWNFEVYSLPAKKTAFGAYGISLGAYGTPQARPSANYSFKYSGGSKDVCCAPPKNKIQNTPLKKNIAL